MPPSATLTEEEIVAYLKKTELPTILVEGQDDMTIFRWLERQISVKNCSAMPCGGRETLLRVFARRAEFPKLRVCFLADRDLWCFTAVPVEFEGVLFTKGYSIENDAINTPALDRLLDPEDQLRLNQLLMPIASWFAFEVNEYRSGRPPIVDIGVASLVDLQRATLRAQHASRALSADDPQVNFVRDNWRTHLRGKTALDLLTCVLSAPGREARHSATSLLESLLKIDPGGDIQLLTSAVRAALTITGPAPEASPLN